MALAACLVLSPPARHASAHRSSAGPTYLSRVTLLTTGRRNVIAEANQLCRGMHRRLTRAALQPGYPDFVSPRPSRADLSAGGDILARYDLPILQKGLAKLDALGEPRTERPAWDRFRSAFHIWLSAFQRQVRTMRAGNVPAFQTAEQRVGELSRPVERYARAAGASECAGL